MSRLDDLKKKADANMKMAQQAAEAENNKEGGTREDDPRFWTITVDEHKKGSATIRFLPSPEGEDSPFVKILSYYFEGLTGEWYREKSPELPV